MISVAKDKQPVSSFGVRLRAVREAKAITLSELAEMVGMHAPNLARLEAGNREPTWPTVMKLCEALGCTPNDFYEPGDEHLPTDDADE